MTNTINFRDNGYQGEVLNDLLTCAVQGNDTFNEHLIHVKSGIKSHYTLPSLKLGEVIQDNVPTPTSSHGSAGEDGENQYTVTERNLYQWTLWSIWSSTLVITRDIGFAFLLLARHSEQAPSALASCVGWKFAQPGGNLVFRELDPQIQSTMLRLLMEKKNEYIGNAIWTSAKGGAEKSGVVAPEDSTTIGLGMEKYFDGFMKRIVDNINTTNEDEIEGGQCIVAGTTLLTDGAAVEKALYEMWKRCPKQIRRSSDLTFVIGWDAWDAYDQYITGQQFKYVDNSQMNRYRFKGCKVIPIVGVPEHTIILAEFSTDMNSNFWVGVDFANDTEVLRVDRLQANSELFFFQMRMKMDVNIVRPAEIVVHTAYKAIEE